MIGIRYYGVFCQCSLMQTSETSTEIQTFFIKGYLRFLRSAENIDVNRSFKEIEHTKMEVGFLDPVERADAIYKVSNVERKVRKHMPI